jgi:cytosine deaminase
MPFSKPTDRDRHFMTVALAEAEQSFVRGGIPVGSVLTREGMVIASGRNRSFETNDPTSHGETDAIRNGGLLADYRGVTLYTTMSPCMMCTGAMLFLGIERVVIGDRETFAGDVEFLSQRGLDVVLLDDADCIALAKRYISENRERWDTVTAGSH